MIESRVKNVLSSLLGSDMSTVRGDTSLKEQLGIDSTEMVEIACALEAEFNVRIPDTKSLVTVGDLCNAVAGMAA